MTAALSTAVVASEHVDIGAPAPVWGLGALFFFMVLLAITLGFGKGRG